MFLINISLYYIRSCRSERRIYAIVHLFNYLLIHFKDCLYLWYVFMNVWLSTGFGFAIFSPFSTKTKTDRSNRKYLRDSDTAVS